MASDGTTTATVLVSAIYALGVENVAAGCNPMSLATNTKTITAEIAQGAMISANGDVHVDNIIAQAMEEVGNGGIVTVREGRTIEDEIVIMEGMRFDLGFFVLRHRSEEPESRVCKTVSCGGRRRYLCCRIYCRRSRPPPMQGDRLSS
jgi:chaperonin GroEL (HSP60 family)